MGVGAGKIQAENKIGAVWRDLTRRVKLEGKNKGFLIKSLSGTRRIEDAQIARLFSNPTTQQLGLAYFFDGSSTSAYS